LKTSIKISPAAYRKLSDEELIRRYIELHEYQAYNALFERFSHIIYGIHLRHSGSGLMARHKTEEVFLNMLTDLKRMEDGQFRPWLYQYINRESNVIPDRVPNEAAGKDVPISADHAHHNMFDESACITRKQAKAYAHGSLIAEERRAIEYHLHDCPLCMLSVEGFRFYSGGDAGGQMDQLTTDFLNDHFSIKYPQVHVSSFVADHSSANKKRTKTPLLTHILLGIIIALVVLFIFYETKTKLYAP
jgi:hypothetical protein